ncbi:MAG: hypothetical protein EA400_10775 [Chromatiaceae bacterium]|nr:MAG: hypothetical protein EA400_10775 [Chromatiaceae bacterium]
MPQAVIRRSPPTLRQDADQNATGLLLRNHLFGRLFGHLAGLIRVRTVARCTWRSGLPPAGRAVRGICCAVWSIAGVACGMGRLSLRVAGRVWRRLSESGGRDQAGAEPNAAIGSGVGDGIGSGSGM